MCFQIGHECLKQLFFQLSVHPLFGSELTMLIASNSNFSLSHSPRLFRYFLYSLPPVISMTELLGSDLLNQIYFIMCWFLSNHWLHKPDLANQVCVEQGAMGKYTVL